LGKLAVLLVQSLGPEARPVGQIRAGVLGQRSLQRHGIVAGETEANAAIPVVRDLRELHADPFVDANRTGGEGDRPAEALEATGQGSVPRNPDVVAMHGVELERGQVVGTRTGRRRAAN